MIFKILVIGNVLYLKKSKFFLKWNLKINFYFKIIIITTNQNSTENNNKQIGQYLIEVNDVPIMISLILVFVQVGEVGGGMESCLWPEMRERCVRYGAWWCRSTHLWHR